MRIPRTNPVEDRSPVHGASLPRDSGSWQLPVTSDWREVYRARAEITLVSLGWLSADCPVELVKFYLPYVEFYLA